MDWNEIACLMEVSAMLYKCTYCVFTLYGSNDTLMFCPILKAWSLTMMDAKGGLTANYDWRQTLWLPIMIFIKDVNRLTVYMEKFKNIVKYLSLRVYDGYHFVVYYFNITSRSIQLCLLNTHTIYWNIKQFSFGFSSVIFKCTLKRPCSTYLW